jgi:hypothetical protein
MKYKYLILSAVLAVAGLQGQATAQITLGTAANFAVLAGSTVTNTGNAVITGGGVGVSPGSSITGFYPPGTVTPPYTVYAAGAAQAEADTQTAYNYLFNEPVDHVLTGQDLGGQTLQSGVYFFRRRLFWTER